MEVNRICASLAPILLLFACERPEPKGDMDSPSPFASREPEATVDEKAAVRWKGAPKQAGGKNVESPNFLPSGLTPEAARGVKGARNVLLSFARMIEQKAYGQAWGQLSPADRQKWNKAEFTAIFKDLDSLTVAIPDGKLEGAAGSRSYTAPVSVTGNDVDGRPVRIEGKAILRQVGTPDGASAGQHRWQLETLTLDWTH